MPGFDYKFLEKPKRRFQCPLCSKAMREPVQVSTCGHRFCDTCLQEFLRYAVCLVCSHEAGDTRASFGRATVNNGCVGVSSPFPQPLVHWYYYDDTRQHVIRLQGLFRLHLLRKTSWKTPMTDVTVASFSSLSLFCGSGDMFFCGGCIICWSEKLFATMQMLQMSNHPISLRSCIIESSLNIQSEWIYC